MKAEMNVDSLSEVCFRDPFMSTNEGGRRCHEKQVWPDPHASAETPGDLHDLFRDVLTRDFHSNDELVLYIQ